MKLINKIGGLVGCVFFYYFFIFLCYPDDDQRLIFVSKSHILSRFCSTIESNLYYFSTVFFFNLDYILLGRYWQIRENSQNCNKIYQKESYSTHIYSEGVGNKVQNPEGKYKVLCNIKTNNWFSVSESWVWGIMSCCACCNPCFSRTFLHCDSWKSWQ